MKRLLCAFVVLVMGASAASAQGVSFGFKSGLYTANITTVPRGWDNTSFKNGFAGGVYVNYAFNENLSLQPEVLYEMKGLNGIIANPFAVVDFTGKFDYIEIPLLARYTITTQGAVKPYFFAGPSLGINLTADIEIEGENQITREYITGSVDYSDVTSATEFVLVFGAGLGYEVGPGMITFDARFDLGLSKMIKGGTVTYNFNEEQFTENIPEEETKTIGFALLVGYAFR